MLCVQIQAGQLQIAVTRQKWPLEKLLTFASRQNPKRGYLFVSKVLGKHWPVSPLVMRQSYDDLTSQISGNVASYVVAMAETATGLGAGVGDSLSRQQCAPVYYQHTTRHMSERPVWLTLDEVHSHATDQLLYEPDPEYKQDILQTERLILVDDEISTGRTIELLAQKLLAKLPRVKEVIIVSLVSWLARRSDFFSDLPVPCKLINLLEGHFTFEPDAQYHGTLPDTVDSELSRSPCRDDLGRFAMQMPYGSSLPDIPGKEPLTVTGEGEHLYLPFLIAEQQARSGRDVLFQSSTRSPIELGDAIASKISFNVNNSYVQHYLYNLANNNRTVMSIAENSLPPVCEFSARFPLIQEEATLR